MDMDHIADGYCVFLDRLDAKVVHLLYANVCVRGGSEAKVLDRYLSDGTRESLAAYSD